MSEENLYSDDHGYGVSLWGSLGLKLHHVLGGKYQGSILDLTPAQAQDNADTYAWYALCEYHILSLFG